MLFISVVVIIIDMHFGARRRQIAHRQRSVKLDRLSLRVANYSSKRYLGAILWAIDLLKVAQASKLANTRPQFKKPKIITLYYYGRSGIWW